MSSFAVLTTLSTSELSEHQRHDQQLNTTHNSEVCNKTDTTRMQLAENGSR